MSMHLGAMPEKLSGFFCSIIFGLKASPMDDDDRARYQKAGVVHIMVASGQQVSILVGTTLALSSFCRLPPLAAAVIASVLAWGFACMAGMGSSILRSSIMWQVMIIGKVFEKESDPYVSLALSALVLLLMNPVSYTHLTLPTTERV